MNTNESRDLEPSQVELLIQRSFDCEDVAPGFKGERQGLTGPTGPQALSSFSSLSKIRSLILLSESDIPSPPPTILEKALGRIIEEEQEVTKAGGLAMAGQSKPMNISKIILLAASLVLFFGLGFVVSLAVRGPLSLDASKNSNQVRKDFIQKLDKKVRELEGLVK